MVTLVLKLVLQNLVQIAKQVQKLTGSNNVGIEVEIHLSLVTGFTVCYGNALSKLIDMSCKEKLEEMFILLDLRDITLASAVCDWFC